MRSRPIVLFRSATRCAWPQRHSDNLKSGNPSCNLVRRRRNTDIAPELVEKSEDFPAPSWATSDYLKGPSSAAATQAFKKLIIVPEQLPGYFVFSRPYAAMCPFGNKCRKTRCVHGTKAPNLRLIAVQIEFQMHGKFRICDRLST